MSTQASIHRIVFTGGPCGGKTTALTHVSERLASLGFRVFQVPETPTLLLRNGFSLAGLGDSELLRFQQTTIRLVMALEEGFQELARISGQPSVLLCDRGTMDPAAYCKPEAWQALLDEQGW